MIEKLSAAVSIRRMVRGDVSALAEAFAHMNKSAEQFDRYHAENLEGTRVTFVALLDGRVVGYANVIWSPGYEPFRESGIPEISDMNVVADLRGRGIGTALVEAAEALVEGADKPVVGIGVGLTEDYSIAQHLYPKLGFVPDGRGDHPDEWGGVTYLTKRLR